MKVTTDHYVTYIQLEEKGSYSLPVSTEEVAHGVLFDYSDGKLVGIEILRSIEEFEDNRKE